jgi:Uma2 family endonuclease
MVTTVSSPEAQTIRREAPPGKMTYEEFLAWADEDTWAEWVDGEVIVLTPASTRHQQIASFLDRVLGLYAEQGNLGIVLTAPFQMKLERGREPDLIFISREHLDRLRETYLDGPADVVVEVVSADSAVRDRGEKFYEYEAGGVQEYWLIDPEREQADFYRLGPGGRYRTIFAGREGVYRSEAVPGFWLQVEWLWQEPLPAIEDILLEIGGEPYARRLMERLRKRGWSAET